MAPAVQIRKRCHQIQTIPRELPTLFKQHHVKTLRNRKRCPNKRTQQNLQEYQTEGASGDHSQPVQLGTRKHIFPISARCFLRVTVWAGCGARRRFPSSTRALSAARSRFFRCLAGEMCCEPEALRGLGLSMSGDGERLLRRACRCVGAFDARVAAILPNH